MDPGDQSQIHTGDLSPAARAAAEAAARMAPGPGEQAGDQIGPYKLLEVLGEGGFGTVWLAERREPMVQRVALKIIKPGMDSRAVIARFEQERQALALMDHPGIAKVLDAGATPAGRPYFVMEHVKGAPITDYCDRQRLTIQNRLELFAKVCEAVQHAHTKGIIHRDLKPSNILVAIRDGVQPRPVVIDFGVAKAISSRLTEKTVFTQHGQIIGTPEYMSPEQAEMSETNIDTRTDIYALGVVLYELLTGALPFDTRTLRSAGYAAIQKMIREVDPPRPSTRLTSLGDQSTRAAEARRVDAQELAAALRSELEWIPLKALRKDRVERYRTASELADDIANYLANRPLIAGPESAAYRARKFVRRNRGSVLAAGLVLGALLLGVIGTSIGMFSARAAEKSARAAEAAEREAKAAAIKSEEQARARAAEAEAVNRFLVTTLQSPSPMERGPNVTVAHVLKEGAPHIATEFAEQPLTQLALHRTYANVLRTLNIYDGSAEHARKALDLARAHRADDKALIAELLMLLGNAQKEFGAYDQTAAALYEARAIIESLSPTDPRRTMSIHNGLGALCHNLGDYDAAERHYRIAMGVTTRDTIDDAINQDRLARLLVDTGRLDEAEPMIRSALAIRERLSGAESTGAAFGRLTLGYLLLARGRAEEAAAQYRAARDIYARLHQTDRAPMARLAAMDLRGVFEDAAAIAGDGNDPTAQAEQVHLGGLERTPVMSLRNRARILYRLDPARSADADALFERAIAIDRRVGGPVQPASEAHTRAIWAQCLLDAGLAERAEEQFRLAADLQRRSLSGESKAMMAQTLLGYARAIIARGRAAEALPMIDEAIQLRTAAAGSEAWTVGVCHAVRAQALAAMGRADEAGAAIATALDKLRSGLGAQSAQTAAAEAIARSFERHKAGGGK